MAETRNGAVLQAAAVPYRTTRLGTLEVLLVSRRSGGWGVPKGGIKKGSGPVETARLESLEEAGVLGAIDPPPLGRYGYKKGGRKHDVVVLPLEVERIVARWQEDGWRRRIWVPISEASSFLGDNPAAPFLDTLRHRLLRSACEPDASDTLRRAA